MNDKKSFYTGQEGCLKFIADILDDYDGCNSVEGLKALIDEARKVAIKGILEKESYGIKSIRDEN